MVHTLLPVHMCVSSDLKHKYTCVCLCVTNTALLIRQTLLVQIFAPLARLLGLYSIKEELEELSFKFSNPEAHGQMVKRIHVLSETQHDVVQAVSRSHQSCSVNEHLFLGSLAHSLVVLCFLSFVVLHCCTGRNAVLRQVRPEYGQSLFFFSNRQFLPACKAYPSLYTDCPKIVSPLEIACGSELVLACRRVKAWSRC